MRRQSVLFAVLTVGGTAAASTYWPPALWAYLLIAPIVLLGLYDMLQAKRTIMRNFPIPGRGRYIMEDLRPTIYQYFVEFDVYRAGYE